MAVSRDGRFACSAGSDQLVIVWEVKSGLPLQALLGHGGFIRSVGFSGDGRYLFSAAADATLRLWDLQKGTLLRTFSGNHGAFHAAALSADGQRLVATGSKKDLPWWQLDWRFGVEPKSTWHPDADLHITQLLRRRRGAHLRAYQVSRERGRKHASLNMEQALPELERMLADVGLGWIPREALEMKMAPRLSEAEAPFWMGLGSLPSLGRRVFG